MIKCLLSFILGVGIGMILMSCFAIAKVRECDNNEKDKKDK